MHNGGEAICTRKSVLIGLRIEFLRCSIRHTKVETNRMWLRGNGQLKKTGRKFKNNNNKNKKIYITL